MHVLVDASVLKPGLGGIATYAEGVVRALAARGDTRLTVATSVPERFADVPGVTTIALPAAVRGFARRALWRERRLRRLALQVGADVVLATTIELPLRRLPAPSLVVVHDLGPLVAPELFGRGKRLRFRLLLAPVLRRAAGIVCVSGATRDALAGAYPALARRSAVVREGPRVAPARAWRPAADPYVLYVGPLLRHKNVATLVRAFAGADLSGVALRIAGTASDAERAALVALPGGRSVEHLGFVDDLQLEALYAGAHVVALPSLHEGFGLPLLEALAAGAPVVASAIPAHAEVAGGAAVLVDDAADPQAWAAALADGLRDPLAAQARVAPQASARVLRYTWPGAAADLYAELAAIATPNH